MKTVKLIYIVRLRRSLSIITVFCWIAIGAESLMAQAFIDSLKANNLSSRQIVYEKQQKLLNMNSKVLELSISLNDNGFDVKESIKVKARVKNLSETQITLGELKHVLFYLSKYPKDEIGRAGESEVYVAAFHFTKNDSLNPYTPIQPNEKYEFDVDLTLLKWDDWLHSFTEGKDIKSLIKGKYYLFMEFKCLGEETSNQAKRFQTFQSFTSNQIDVRLNQKENSSSTNKLIENIL